MKRLVTTWYGTFLFEDRKCLKFKLFPKNAKEIAKRLKQIEDNEILEEERELIRGIAQFFVSEKRLTQIGGELLDEGAKVEIGKPEDFGFALSVLHEAMLELGKMKMRIAIPEEEHIIQAVNTIEELNKTANLLTERLNEWFGLHFPELKPLGSEKFIQFIAESGDIRKIAENHPELELPETMGTHLSENDRNAIKALAGALLNLYDTKNRVQKYVENKMKEIAPNITHLAGPTIGAKLLSMAGSLEKLARMPSSTVQLLGAETALFRHLKGGSKPPKYGIIFQHPYVHRAHYWRRGKIARALAAKISIAAKVDWTKGTFIGDVLEQNLNKRIEEIARKYPQPPEKKVQKISKRIG